MWIRNWILRSSVVKQAIPHKERLGNRLFCLLPQCWALSWQPQQVLTCLWRNASLFSRILWVSWIQAPLAFHWCLGAHLSGGNLERCGTRCGVQILYSLREKLGVEDPPDYMTMCQGLGLWWRYVLVSPIHFDVGIFCHVVCRSHSASFWISVRENCSKYSCTFGVSVGGGCPGASCATILFPLLASFKQ